MKTIQPYEALVSQSDLLNHFLSPAFIKTLADCQCAGPPSAPFGIVHFYNMLLSSLSRAQPYLARKAVCAQLQESTACTRMTARDWHLSAQALPSPSGYVLLESPISVTVTWASDPAQVTTLLWTYYTHYYEDGDPSAGGAGDDGPDTGQGLTKAQEFAVVAALGTISGQPIVRPLLAFLWNEELTYPSALMHAALYAPFRSSAFYGAGAILRVFAELFSSVDARTVAVQQSTIEPRDWMKVRARLNAAERLLKGGRSTLELEATVRANVHSVTVLDASVESPSSKIIIPA